MAKTVKPDKQRGMEPALVAVTLFTLAGLFAIALIADKKLAESERDPPSN